MQIQFTTDVVIRETESIPIDLAKDGRTLASLVATIVHDRIDTFCQMYGDGTHTGDDGDESGYMRRIEIVLPEELSLGHESHKRKPTKAKAS